MMRQPVKLEIMSIVHGQSEYNICRSMRSNLRLKHEIVARDKGKTSIQITSVLDILNDSRFSNFNAFIREFPDIEHTKKQLINFKLYIIMDVDDCTPQQKQDFISKQMFKNHWLQEYIVPIYNDPNLEFTMQQAQITVQKKSDYILLFPTNHGDLDLKTAQDYLDKLKKCTCSNLRQYMEHCIFIALKNI